jgi:hypothetical protein
MTDVLSSAVKSGKVLDDNEAASLIDCLRKGMVADYDDDRMTGSGIGFITAGMACEAVPVLFTHALARISELEAKLEALTNEH